MKILRNVIFQVLKWKTCLWLHSSQWLRVRYHMRLLRSLLSLSRSLSLQLMRLRLVKINWSLSFLRETSVFSPRATIVKVKHLLILKEYIRSLWMIVVCYLMQCLQTRLRFLSRETAKRLFSLHFLVLLCILNQLIIFIVTLLWKFLHWLCLLHSCILSYWVELCFALCSW